MPETDHPEYNPNIIGFVSDLGPVVIPLNTARKRYGELPSEYKLMPEKDGRLEKKGLNLALGKLVTEALNQKGNRFKQIVFDFYDDWHRDYGQEFHIDIRPFQNLNETDKLKAVLDQNRHVMAAPYELQLRPFLIEHSLVRRDILNSIKDADLPTASERMLAKKIKHLPQGKKYERVRASLSLIRANRIINKIKQLTALDVMTLDDNILTVFADDISRELIRLSDHIALSGVDDIKGIRGSGVEIEYAPRDGSYLMLGKETGDCTSDKSPFQADTEVENIYWTVFPWILDKHYQIMKVYFNNEFVMKVHVLPLFLMHEDLSTVVLSVDAIETVKGFREELETHKRDGLIENRELIFSSVMTEVEALADRMGIQRIYAEKFSNTKWVRQRFESFQEIYFHVDSLIKIDALEDVYCLSLELGRRMKSNAPGEVFMEIQMKNTSLQPLLTHRTAGVKPYAVIRGNPGEGIPMKKVIGV